MTDVNALQQTISEYNERVSREFVLDTARAVERSGWLYFNNVRVNSFNGSRLTYAADGRSVRASLVSVYVTDVGYTVGVPGEKFTSVGGRHVSSDGGWRYPSAYQCEIVIHAAGESTVSAIRASSAAQAQRLIIPNTQDIIVNINDGRRSPGYTDNGGGFDLHLRIDQA